jgi:nuclear migration protein JNM1
VLVSELERLHEARRKLAASGLQQQQHLDDRKITNGDAASSTITVPVDTMQKLDTVLPTLSRLDPLIPLVPALLARLDSLASLHASSNSFTQDMINLESGMKRSQVNTDELKNMLGNLETSFTENASRIEANFKVVEARMESITQRVEKLSSR